jgi:hypothetical protein
MADLQLRQDEDIGGGMDGKPVGCYSQGRYIVHWQIWRRKCVMTAQEIVFVMADLTADTCHGGTIQ